MAPGPEEVIQGGAECGQGSQACDGEQEDFGVGHGGDLGVAGGVSVGEGVGYVKGEGVGYGLNDGEGRFGKTKMGKILAAT